MENLKGLTDEELEKGLMQAAADERRSLTAVLLHLQEFEERDLDRRKGFTSLFAYCMSQLGYSEDAAAKRIQVARKARKFPRIIKLLDTGEIHLSGACLVTPYLTEENAEGLLSAIRGKSKRQVEFLVAERFPQREQRETIRALGVTAPAAGTTADPAQVEAAVAPGQPEEGCAPRPLLEPYPVVKPFAPDRVRFEFNASRDLYDKIERAKQLLRHKYPFCTLEQLFGESLESLLEDWDPVRRMARKRPSSAQPKPSDPGSRAIPQHVKDEVYRRDGGCCAFVGEDGKRCREKSGLEYDHIRPHALGGLSIPDNLRLLCEPHNRYEAERRFGRWEKGRRAVPEAESGEPLSG